MYDVIIIGGGCAGYPAAVYAARFNMKTLVITKERGGLITTTHLVENWPGESSITGQELAQKLEDHVKNLDVPIEDAVITKMSRKEGGTFVLESYGGKTFETKTIILATGTTRKRLDVPGDKELYAKGVSYCATCDAAFFKGKVVGMVGGSDSAVKEGLYLTEFASKVYLIYRKEKPRAEPINMKRMEQKIREGKIELITNTNVVKMTGDKKLEGVELDKPFNGSTSLALGGLFIEIGATPNVELAQQLGVALNKKQEIIIDHEAKTNVSGVYAAGDVADGHYKQAITGAGEGVAAAFAAYEYIQEHLS